MSRVDMNLLKHLSEAFGVSGRERQVREVILSEIRSCCDEIKVCLLYTSDAADE